MSSSMSMALIPYTPPQMPMEFIRSEVERGLKNGTIKPEQLTPKLSIPSALSELIDLNLRPLRKIEREKKLKSGGGISDLLLCLIPLPSPSIIAILISLTWLYIHFCYD